MKSLLASHVRSAGVLVAALAASLASSALAETTVKSTPVGVLSRTLPVGSYGLAFPLIEDDVYVGVVQSNSTSALTFASTSGTVGSLLSASRPYYVEITAGTLTGERFDLDTAATITAANASAVLNLSATSNSTTRTITADSLIGARCVIRPHLTLAGLQAMFSPVLQGNDQSALADGVRIYNGLLGLQVIYLRGDNATWNAVGNPTDQRTRVIPPDASIQLDIKSGTKQWVHLGSVRANPFRKNFIRGIQPFASGFPIDLTPVQARAYVDLNAPAAGRWTGSDTLSLADQIDVRFSTSFAATLYYLRGDGLTWTASTGSVQDVSGQKIIGATDLILIKRNKVDSTYSVPVPYTL